MDVRVRLFAGLRERAGVDELVLDGMPDGATVAELAAALRQRHPALGELAGVSAVVGTTYVPWTRSVAPGEAVAFLPPVSGGDAAAPADPDGALRAGVFELSAAPLDPGLLHRRLVHPDAGAVVVFTGTTRATNRGQDVVQLDYEAFHEMAGPEMARIFDECLARYGEGGSEPTAATQPGARVLRMLCVHRVGTVGVAESSVVVGVSSPHRDTAFQAARFLIDALKARLPVWKKEVYGGGHHWIGERS